MKRRLALAGLGCCLALALPTQAWGATDYDGDGFIADDCAPLDAAAHPGATDVPDTALEDLDCDGIDGSAAGAFFVSTAGSDAGLGSAAGPFRTIGFAVAKAAAAVPKRDVYVQAGTYTEHVVLAGGVSIYGGYGPGGSRALAPATTIQAPAGQPEAVFADGATGVELQLLEIKGPNVGPGASSYALRAIGGASLALIAVKATGGTAGAGGAGGTGTAGTGGNPGRGGGRVGSTCEEPDFNYLGGTAGRGAAGGGVPGGAGADGVIQAVGKTGSPGASTSALTGGDGGVGGHPINGNCSHQASDPVYCGGHDGSLGKTGADGDRGTGAAFGIAGAGVAWANPAATTAGGPAAPGSGGGGGGSGYSKSATDPMTEVNCNSGAGGGGGGSGTGGTGGGGGSNGGGSFAVYLAGSALVVDGGLLTGGSGGAGGKGGDGGSGGTGGAGGAFQLANNPLCYNGGEGGKGGDGGRGGGGGGGAGGPSTGVFATSTSNFAVHANATVAGGTAGAGGLPGAGGAGAASGGNGASAGTLAQPGANATAKDFDGDGTTDAADACPAVAAPGGCPARPAKLADGDGDAIPDGSDACPAQAGGPTDADANGCPGSQADGDGDGFLAGGQDCNDSNAAIHPGAIEIVGNKVDENCDNVVAPFPRVTATVSTGGGVTRTTTIFLRLLIREIPAGGKVQLRCSGGNRRCPFKAKRLKVSKQRTANGLKLLSKRKRKGGLVFKPGATLEVRITAPAAIGKVVRYKIVRSRFPVGKTLCLAPGASKPKGCPS